MSGKQSGFGSKLDKFPPNYGKSYFSTTHQDSYGKPRPMTAIDYHKTFDSTYRTEAGGNLRPIED